MFEIGQIMSNSGLGNLICSFASDAKYKVYVEIGTWRGGGSTKCFAEQVLKRPEAKLISIESNKEMAKFSTELWKNHLSENFKIIHGRIVEEDELFKTEEIKNEIDFNIDWLTWLEQDLKAIKTCENILDNLPKEIDVVLLDGGEFSSYAEFQKLKHKTKVFILDDTNVLKNRNVRKELLSSPLWKCFIDQPNDRNGYSIFVKKD